MANVRLDSRSFEEIHAMNMQWNEQHHEVILRHIIFKLVGFSVVFENKKFKIKKKSFIIFILMISKSHINPLIGAKSHQKWSDDNLEYKFLI